MNTIFKFGGWFFLIVGSVMLLLNIDSLDDAFAGDFGDAMFGIIPLVVGAGQALLGLIFIRLSKYIGSGGLKDGLLQRQKLEQRIIELEAKGVDTTRYRKLLENMDKQGNQ